MPKSPDFRLLDAARMAADDVNRLIDRFARPTPSNLRDPVELIAIHVKEAFGYPVGAERDHCWRAARQCAERANERLRAHFGAKRLPPEPYWRNHNRLLTISKMLSAMIHNG